jgi:molecular chaperone DnaK
MSITITASTKLSDSEKERMVSEAEQYAEADKQAKEEAETRNEADALIYSTEKMLGELADKISGDVRARIQGSLDALKNAVKEGSVAEIKAKMEELQQVAQEAGSEIYKQAAAAQQAEQAAGAQQQGPEEDQGKKTVDADYKVVDEDKKQ